jgi:hypothetical protein
MFPFSMLRCYLLIMNNDNALDFVIMNIYFYGFIG